jgi:tetratricopeptide (TPR) repeat protein
VQLDPGYADAWAHLGYIYREEVQHNRNLEPNALDRAMTAAQTAIELDGANPMARFAMSMIQFSLGNSNAGMAEAEKAVALNPNDATKMLAVAVYAVNAGEIERGVELARTAEAIIPTLPRWFPMIYTSAHYQAGEYDEALTEFSKWDEEGNDVQWHFNRVAILGQLGRISEASAELERTYELFPGFAADPVGELRKFLLTDATVEKYYDGLMKAGLEDEFPD